MRGDVGRGRPIQFALWASMLLAMPSSLLPPPNGRTEDRAGRTHDAGQKSENDEDMGPTEDEAVRRGDETYMGGRE